MALTDPFIIGLTTALEYRCLATDRVRFVGEPVAVVLATDRYLAEDALELVKVEYSPLPGGHRSGGRSRSGSTSAASEGRLEYRRVPRLHSRRCRSAHLREPLARPR